MLTDDEYLWYVYTLQMCMPLVKKYAAVQSENPSVPHAMLHIMQTLYIVQKYAPKHNLATAHKHMATLLTSFFCMEKNEVSTWHLC